MRAVSHIPRTKGGINAQAAFVAVFFPFDTDKSLASLVPL